MAKLYAGIVAGEVINECMQLYGGYGYSTDLWVERAWRDSRLIRIGGGTDEIMREVISKTAGVDFSRPGFAP
jgi:alkylation response protein AidB-like acyl-CoA dehydrogenase